MSILPVRLSFPSRAASTRVAPLLGALALAVGLGLWLAPFAAELHGTNAPPARQTITVVEAPLTARLDEVGVIQPGARLTVTAPFDGFVKEMWQDVDARIEAGAPLLAMDTSELDARLRDAESALLKTSAAIEALDRWSVGPDMARARQTLAAANAQLATLKRQTKEAKALFDRGIISRNEYEGLQQQVAVQADQVDSAKLDLKAVQDHANERSRRLADIDITAARTAFDALTAQKAQDVVRAPQGGILMRPPAASSDRGEGMPIGRGSHVSRGQGIATIADLNSFIVEMRVDEVDVDQIKVGQSVTMQSDSFPGETMQGVIISVGGEADLTASLGGSAHFLVKARFIADEQHRMSVRIGMSARVTIVTLQKPSSICIPGEAVTSWEGHATVQTWDSTTDTTRTVAVKLGLPTPSGIEVISGLKAGDMVVLR